VRDAIRRNAAVHMAVAKRLVPSGQSLFVASGRGPRDTPADHEFDLFDRFFGVDRRPACHAGFPDQVRARVTAALADSARSPLVCPEAGPAVDIRTRMPQLLHGVAALATACTAGRPSGDLAHTRS
jgi:hypothetical protein